MVAGVHFLPDDPPGQIAQKLLRVNLSIWRPWGQHRWDTCWRLPAKEISDAWLGEFCAGLAADNAAFGIALRRRHGVDTGAADPVAHRDRRGADRLGAAAARRGTRRRLWVSGTLGDAALGLKVLQGALDVTEPRAPS